MDEEQLYTMGDRSNKIMVVALNHLTRSALCQELLRLIVRSFPVIAEFKCVVKWGWGNPSALWELLGLSSEITRACGSVNRAGYAPVACRSGCASRVCET